MPRRPPTRPSRPGRVGCGMGLALALVAAGVGGVGLGGWLLTGGPGNRPSPTRPTQKADDHLTRPTGKAEPTGKTRPTGKADDAVVRNLQVQFDLKAGANYLYVTHHHPGDPLEDVTLTLERRGSGVTKTTTHPLWEADRPLRVEILAFAGKGRYAHVTGTATQDGRPVRIDAEVEIDATPRGAGEKKKGKFGPPIPGATTPL
ncbi:hypothetical protein J0H58_01835, partial [bacterium]|nr:hypothetical protein [bacterium]